MPERDQDYDRGWDAATDYLRVVASRVGRTDEATGLLLRGAAAELADEARSVRQRRDPHYLRSATTTTEGTER